MDTGKPPYGNEDIREVWGRITSRLEQRDPGALARLGGRGDPTAIRAAEERMGLTLPPELRQWLLVNDIGAGGHHGPGPCLVATGCAGVVPGGGLLLGLTDIERVHRHMTGVEESLSPGDPDDPFWRREWVPIVAERDGFHGMFLDTRTGRVGSWSEGSGPQEGRFTSLFAYFKHVADQLEGITPDGAGPTGRGSAYDRDTDAIRRWARANGHVVNDRGRVPADIRKAYESPR